MYLCRYFIYFAMYKMPFTKNISDRSSKKITNNDMYEILPIVFIILNRKASEKSQ